MNSDINYDLAQARTADLLRDAHRARLVRASRADRNSTRRWRMRLPSDRLARVVTRQTVHIPQCQEP
jgi:hypothetical protein